MLNKKVLVITFHACPNYGAVLQAYGLSEFLKTIFTSVKFLDYCPSSVMDEYKVISTYSLGSILYTAYSAPSFIRKKRRFKDFLLNNIQLTQRYERVSDIKSIETDICILGSDQIWNPDITGGIDGVFFGRLPFCNHPKILSYAASIGKQKYTDDEVNTVRPLIQEISAISLREQYACDFFREQFSRDAVAVLDPTLLVGIDCYKKFVTPSKYGKYVLIYTLKQNPENDTRAVARYISKEMKLPLIEINGNRKKINRVQHKVLYDVGPADFISLLANAEYVVTDSFHGTVFSILFHRSFTAIPHKNRGGRIEQLLNITGLQERLQYDCNHNCFQNNINWRMVDELIANERKSSIRFIMDAINE